MNAILQLQFRLSAQLEAEPVRLVFELERQTGSIPLADIKGVIWGKHKYYNRTVYKVRRNFSVQNALNI